VEALSDRFFIHYKVVGLHKHQTCFWLLLSFIDFWPIIQLSSYSDFFFLVMPFQNVTLSENDLVACCGFQCGDGCDGGYPLSAWQYFISTGVVTAEV
jgi:hypothetical protein